MEYCELGDQLWMNILYICVLCFERFQLTPEMLFLKLQIQTYFVGYGISYIKAHPLN